MVKLFSLAKVFSILAILSSSNTFCQQDLISHSQNHWGMLVSSGVNLPTKFNINSDFVIFDLQPTIKFSFSFNYLFNINKKAAIITGVDMGFKTFAFNYDFNSFEINKKLKFDLDLNNSTNEKWGYAKSNVAYFNSSLINFSTPILFKYNIYTNDKIIISAETGVNFRFYIPSLANASVVYTIFDNGIKKNVTVFSFELETNSKRSIQIESQTGISIYFILKNKKLLSINADINLMLYGINKGILTYLPNTIVELKEERVISDNYFGLSIGYLFTGTNKPNNKLMRNKNKDWLPNNDGDY